MPVRVPRPGIHRSLGSKVEYLPITKLKPNEANARTHPDRQIEKVAAGIREFGFIGAVIIDQNRTIISGHARVEAAGRVGLTDVPCIRVTHLSEAQKRALMIADNRLAELASWDERKLAAEFEFLAAEFEFALDLTGFETAEIDLVIEQQDHHDEPDPADQLPPTNPATPVVTKAGDLWFVGDHRLLCGDAREAASYAALLDDEHAQMIFTDPPYNVPVKGHVSGLGSVQHREFAMASGEMARAEFSAFLKAVCGHLVAFSADGSIHFVCMDWRHVGEMIAAVEGCYSELKNICVWNKGTGGMGSLYRSQHEFLFVCKAGKAPHINNIELGRYGRYRTNLWDYAGANSFGRNRAAELAMHPTVKPVALVADAIRDCSKRGGIILDPFAGSGTTIIAAERTGRRAAAMEIDPAYVDTAIRRWQSMTGQPALHAATGMTFADLEQRHLEEQAAAIAHDEDARGAA